MIEPQSAQLGASAWVWKLTLVPPKFSEIAGAVPPPLLAFAAPFPFAACPFPSDPFVAMTANGSEAFGVSTTSAETAVAFGASVSAAVGGSTAGPPLATAEGAGVVSAERP